MNKCWKDECELLPFFLTIFITSQTSTHLFYFKAFAIVSITVKKGDVTATVKTWEGSYSETNEFFEVQMPNGGFARLHLTFCNHRHNRPADKCEATQGRYSLHRICLS